MSVEIVVDRLARAVVDVAQKLGHAAFAFAGEEVDPEIDRFLNSSGSLGQHREAAADVKPADDHGNAGARNFAAEIERARKLVGLHADEADEAAAGRADLPDRAA